MATTPGRCASAEPLVPPDRHVLLNELAAGSVRPLRPAAAHAVKMRGDAGLTGRGAIEAQAPQRRRRVQGACLLILSRRRSTSDMDGLDGRVRVVECSVLRRRAAASSASSRRRSASRSMSRRGRRSGGRPGAGASVVVAASVNVAAGRFLRVGGGPELIPGASGPAAPRSLRRRTLAARNGSQAHALSSVSGRLRRSTGRGGFSVVGEQRAKFGPRGPHGPPETAVRVDLPPWRAAFPASYAAISTCRRLTFNARHTRSHSQRTFASPRKLKRRKPSACLIQP